MTGLIADLGRPADGRLGWAGGLVVRQIERLMNLCKTTGRPFPRPSVIVLLLG